MFRYLRVYVFCPVEYGVQIGLNCPYGAYNENVKNTYGLSTNGYLKWILNPSVSHSPNEYCIESGDDDLIAIICFKEDNNVR